MENKSKIWHRLCLALAMVLFLAVRTDVLYAASAPTLTAVSNVSNAGEGDTVEVTVSLKNNPGFTTLGMALSYDSDALSYESSSWSQGFSSEDMVVASDTGSEINLSAVCADSYGENGALVTVKFQALQDMDAIPVSVSLRDMSDASMAAVSDYKVKEEVSVQQEDKSGEKKESASKSTDKEKKHPTAKNSPMKKRTPRRKRHRQ